MSYQVRDVSAEHFGWLEQRIGRLGHWKPRADFRAIAAVDQRGQIQAMVGYENWRPGSVEVHVAMDTPAAFRSLVVPAFGYPFLQAGVRVLIGFIAENNPRALRLAKRVGFQLVHQVLDGQSDGVALNVLEMRRNQCRWIPGVRRVA